MFSTKSTPKPLTFLQVCYIYNMYVTKSIPGRTPSCRCVHRQSIRPPCKYKQRVQQPDLFLIFPPDFFSHTHTTPLTFCALPVPKRVAVAEGSLKIKATANDKTEFKIKIEPGCMQV